MQTPTEPTPILRIAIDGPRDKPNGKLLVEVLDETDRIDIFKCRVLDVIASSGRTCKKGDIISVHLHNLLKVEA